ncbi:hypothetical protein CR152_10225 [Massilia violaceinigra]|uniref:Uncharacterized protein n=2 Tax=Massilia violaceinigra TaxID=2045208 RepID=A0A2D2DIQ9_9BURK|nr:hypothetical protein CR152_10225 [Massilia violaceinigra]
MFNLKNLAIAATADMPVRDASGEAQFNEKGEPLTITLHSPGTKEFQKAKHAADERNSTRVFGRMQGKSESKQSADDKNIERAEFLAAVTASFNGGAGLDGKKGFELFKATYADIEIGHIADDAEKFLGDRGNFKKPSPTV